MGRGITHAAERAMFENLSSVPKCGTTFDVSQPLGAPRRGVDAVNTSQCLRNTTFTESSMQMNICAGHRMGRLSGSGICCPRL